MIQAIKSVSPAKSIVTNKAAEVLKDPSMKPTNGQTSCINAQCFIEGTKIKTEDGSKNIEDIKVGDKVLAFDETTGKKEYKEVVRLFRNETKTWVHITLNGLTAPNDQTSKSDEIVCTPEHPFYVMNTDSSTPSVNFEGHNNNEHQGQWVASKDLKPGMQVL